MAHKSILKDELGVVFFAYSRLKKFAYEGIDFLHSETMLESSAILILEIVLVSFLWVVFLGWVWLFVVWAG